VDLEKIQQNPILRHTFQFALQIEAYVDRLYELKKFDLAKQLFRSGTSIGANVFESQQAESKHDFIHKLKIAAKEASETHFWLLICQNRPGYPPCEHLLSLLEEINKLLSAIIASTKKSQRDA
jgi:four helix bundle protein